MRMAALALALAATLSCERELPVLLYHEVGCGSRDPRDVPASEFEAQVDSLEAHGYQAVPLSVLLAGRGLPVRPVGISFDDGAACLYGSAFPILARHKMPFELFLPADWIGADALHRGHQRLGDGEEIPSLVWPEVRAMVASGLAEVGAHGRRHLYLRRASQSELEAEVLGSRALLAAALAGPVPLFAYPFGAYDLRVIASARRAGYAGAFAVGNGPGGTFAYRRRSIHRGLTLEAFARALAPRWIFPFVNHD